MTLALSRIADLEPAVGKPTPLTDSADFENRLFRREDWEVFRTLDGVAQRAGVPVQGLARLVLKELADNALDAGGEVQVGRGAAEREFFVQDGGPGLHGTDEEIAELFSIRRPLTSSKLLRQPTCGALGNGLRVVAGTVLASAGDLTVSTAGRVLRLDPQDDGSTQVERAGSWSGTGTRISVTFGPGINCVLALGWAEQAQFFTGGEPYRGRSSAYWYTSEAFFELAQAAGARTVRALVAELDGCTGTKAGEVAAGFAGRAAIELSRDETDELLARARAAARPVKPERLGNVGRQPDLPDAYARRTGTFKVPLHRGPHAAEIPFVVEAWAQSASAPHLCLLVNRTPVPAEISFGRTMKDKTCCGLKGCGLSEEQRGIATPVQIGRHGDFGTWVNIIAPWLPKTNDSKSPDLSALAVPIAEALEAAVRQCRRSQRGPGRRSVKDVVLGVLPQAIETASDGGQQRFTQRQLYYTVRPMVIAETSEAPTWENFCNIVTAKEADDGQDIAGMMRDVRGLLYHPHTHEEIPLGTIAVERYERPKWTFNKILFIEKEGFFPLLIAARWPERHDCALVTSKGQPTRAVRDLLDLLGETDEEITFFCIHDADAAGTIIFQSLQKETRARKARKVRIVNLGLEPEEGLAMGLPVEPAEYARTPAIADYVSDAWRDWLLTQRIELNAMGTADLLAWLDKKMAAHAQGKLIPPAPVLDEHLISSVRERVENALTERILREAGLDEQVADAVTELAPTLQRRSAKLHREVARTLAENPVARWTEPVEEIADNLVNNHLQVSEGGAS